jgi:hypothetical protein
MPAVDAMAPDEIAGLDPGIADTVLWLRRHGFRTCDSGDGVAKFADAPPDDEIDHAAEPQAVDPHSPACAMPIANVAMMVERGQLADEADRLRALIESTGAKVEPQGPEFGAAVEIHASYDPATGTALILLIGFVLPSGVV